MGRMVCVFVTFDCLQSILISINHLFYVNQFYMRSSSNGSGACWLTSPVFWDSKLLEGLLHSRRIMLVHYLILGCCTLRPDRLAEVHLPRVLGSVGPARCLVLTVGRREVGVLIQARLASASSHGGAGAILLVVLLGSVAHLIVIVVCGGH